MLAQNISREKQFSELHKKDKFHGVATKFSRDIFLSFYAGHKKVFFSRNFLRRHRISGCITNPSVYNF